MDTQTQFSSCKFKQIFDILERKFRERGRGRQNEKGKETLFRGNCFFLCFSRVACSMWQASLGSASHRVEALSDYDNDAENNDNDASDLR